MRRKVRLTKLKAVADPRYPTPNFEDYRPGFRNVGQSLPIDYTAEGICLDLPEIGKNFYLLRSKRNDVECAGELRTSAVKRVVMPVNSEEPITFTTENSVYELEDIE